MITTVRKSIKLKEEDWFRLDEMANGTKSVYSGRPSWRRMVMRIARGEISVKVKRKHNQ